MTAVYAILDRALANHLWLNIYSTAVLKTFSIFGSNHGPIFLKLSPPNPNEQLQV